MQLTNSRGLKLQCSHYRPYIPSTNNNSNTKKNNNNNNNDLKNSKDTTSPPPPPPTPIPCVIYGHGNCGSRLDAIDSVQCLLSSREMIISVFVMDFCGSGLSEGEYVSLGYFEKDDLKTAVSYPPFPSSFLFYVDIYPYINIVVVLIFLRWSIFVLLDWFLG